MWCVCSQLTELKALLGCVGQVRFVMGCISQLQDGRYFLEDMSDSLPIDLTEAQTTSGFFTGELAAMARWMSHFDTHLLSKAKARDLEIDPIVMHKEI